METNQWIVLIILITGIFIFLGFLIGYHVYRIGYTDAYVDFKEKGENVFRQKARSFNKRKYFVAE